MSSHAKAMCAIPLAALAAFSQSFEVASIKPAAPGQSGTSFHRNSGNRFSASNATLKILIVYAYGLRENQVTGGPSWLESEHYDIVARPENAPETMTKEASDEQLRWMVQALLTERFKLAAHRETREGAIYTLVLAKGGTKLEKADPEDKDSGMGIGRAHMDGHNVPVTEIAAKLSNAVGRNVIDGTGLKGPYNFKLQWTPDRAQPTEAAEADGPSIFTAVQEQLGLRLEPGKGPFEIFVIDHAEKATEN